VSKKVVFISYHMLTNTSLLTCSGGEGAEKPEDRNVKGWGPNNLSSQFSQHEGRRNPVLDGGSHEGGHDSKGNSKT